MVAVDGDRVGDGDVVGPDDGDWVGVGDVYWVGVGNVRTWVGLSLEFIFGFHLEFHLVDLFY